MTKLRRVALAALLLIGASAGAQAPIPIRQVAKDATSPVAGPYRVFVRELSDGRVLVAEQNRPPAISVFDAKLSTRTVIADSSIFTAGSFAGLLGITAIPLPGDSSLVPDMNGNALLVIDAAGKVARVLALPRATDARILSGVSAMSVRFDAKGQLVYRGAYVRPPPPAPPPGTLRPASVTPDSFPLVRANLETRVIDTLAALAMPSGIRSSISFTEDNKLVTKMIRQPLPTTDDWAVLSDGSIAIVRGHDYHIDWIYPDGTRASTPKMSFDWRRVTLEDKERMLDSLRKESERSQRSRDSMYAARGQKTPPSPFAEEYVPIGDIPDYIPPIRAASVYADADNNVWILPTTSAAATGGLLYDVVNRRGEVVQRVQLPGGCLIAGFGPRYVVYANCEVIGPDGKARTYYLNRFRIVGAASAY